ncbi:MAG: hypothetical protein ACHP65_02715 [Legionellales bacterium]
MPNINQDRPNNKYQLPFFGSGLCHGFNLSLMGLQMAKNYNAHDGLTATDMRHLGVNSYISFICLITGYKRALLSPFFAGVVLGVALKVGHELMTQNTYSELSL